MYKLSLHKLLLAVQRNKVAFYEKSVADNDHINIIIFKIDGPLVHKYNMAIAGNEVMRYVSLLTGAQR